MTLWNVLLRVRAEDRGEVLKRMEDVVGRAGGPVPKVDPEAVLRLDPAALEEWWKAAAGGR